MSVDSNGKNPELFFLSTETRSYVDVETHSAKWMGVARVPQYPVEVLILPKNAKKFPMMDTKGPYHPCQPFLKKAPGSRKIDSQMTAPS